MSKAEQIADALLKAPGSGTVTGYLEEAAAELRRLAAECEALRADAGRYRWLVEMDMLSEPSVDMANAFARMTGSALDSAIDSAMFPKPTSGTSPGMTPEEASAWQRKSDELDGGKP